MLCKFSNSIYKLLFPFLHVLKVHFLDYPSHSTRPPSVQSRTCLNLTKIFLVESHSADLWEHHLWENVHLGINYLVTYETGIIVFLLWTPLWIFNFNFHFGLFFRDRLSVTSKSQNLLRYSYSLDDYENHSGS